MANLKLNPADSIYPIVASFGAQTLDFELNLKGPFLFNNHEHVITNDPSMVCLQCAKFVLPFFSQNFFGFSFRF
jgi:hypothetical protein